MSAAPAAPRQAPRAPAASAMVGMVGAGQLARMTHQASIGLGVELRVLAGSPDDAAVRAGAGHRLGSPADLDDLRALAEDCAVLTFDHEGIPAAHLERLEAEGVVLAPGAAAKRLAQDKLHARRTLSGLGFRVPPYAEARRTADIDAFAAEHGWPLVAKAPRGGYDGRGVWRLEDAREAARVLADAQDGLVVEPALELDTELAIAVARSATGACVAYPVVETVQQDGMCRELLAPAPVPAELVREAQALAVRLAGAVGAVGMLAVELFVTADGLLVNELALRPHNSGHWTIEGSVTSQFEQHLRAILGWPLGDPAATAPAVVTVNVVGGADGSDPASRVAEALTVPGAHVHLYGKRPRPGRKLGHVTVCGAEPATVRAAARRAAALLEGRLA